jgi:hypothetical protein
MLCLPGSCCDAASGYDRSIVLFLTGLIGDGALHFITHAWARLLKPTAKVVPYQAIVKVIICNPTLNALLTLRLS